MDSIGNLFISNALLSLQSADILVGISDGLKQKSYKLMSDAFIRAAVNIKSQDVACDTFSQLLYMQVSDREGETNVGR
jgi:hypothetical protein